MLSRASFPVLPLLLLLLFLQDAEKTYKEKRN